MAGAGALNPASDASRGYRVGLVSLAAIVAVVAGWVATREWFSRDDFVFLAYVQATEPWSWWQVYFPFEERFWSFYRPLSMETFFRLGHGWFGLDARGYFGISLALHFASGPLVFRLARQLGLSVAVAWATAILAITRPGSLGEIYYGSVFMYVIESFFSLACLSAFLAAPRSRAPWRFQMLSCAALLLALCCNEHAVILPAVLALGAWMREPTLLRRPAWLRAAAAAWPQWAMVAVYGLFRFAWIEPVEVPATYAPSLHSEILANAGRLLAGVFGGASGLAVALAAAAGALVLGLWRAEPAIRTAWLRQAGFAAGWLVLAIVPFALLVAPQGRWSMPLVFPAALLWGACFEPAWRRLAVVQRGACEVGLIVLLAASLPIPTLLAQGRAPLGAVPRQVAAWVTGQEPALSDRAVLVFLFGASELAAAEEAERFRYLAYGGALLNAIDPRTERVMRFHDATRRAPRNVVRADSVYLALRPGMAFEAAPGRLLDREMRRGFERR